jgi:hypothetical protein
VVRAQRVLVRDPPRGVHLSFVRFLTGFFCRGASPPQTTRRASLLSITRCLCPDNVHVHVHGSDAAYMCRHARAWTWTDGRSSVCQAASVTHADALSASDRLETPTLTGLRVGRLPAVYGDPGRDRRAWPASRHGANPRPAPPGPTGTPSTRARETLPVNTCRRAYRPYVVIPSAGRHR